MYINIAYLGYNDFRKFKRGVENVIHFQSRSHNLRCKYYLFFNNKNEIFHRDNIIHIGIKNTFILKYIILNAVLIKLRKKRVIIHSHNYLMSLLSIFRTNIFTVHDAIYYQRKSNKDKFRYLFYFIEKLVYLKCQKIHFISQYALNQSLINHHQLKKSIIIYNTTPFEGIDNNEISPYKSNNSYNLFAVRGIQKRTRIDLLIDFASFIKDKRIYGKNVNIYIAGKGPLLEEYRNLIKERKLNNIFLLGYVDDQKIVNYYKNCDMVIMPCEYAEGFGLPIIEGYYYNKPVIASNRCAVPEIIISPEFLFENTPIDIYNTIINSHNNMNFKNYYNERFSSLKIQEELSKVYNSIANL